MATFWRRTLHALLLLCALRLSAGRVPIRAPSSLQVSPSAPRQPPPVSVAAPLLEVAPPPEERSAGLYSTDEFPAEPRPRPNSNNSPLPLSPPGTYLHTAVEIQGKMYVYGGVASYEPDKYMNDLWLFDAAAGEYTQLQGSYVPPLPKHAGLTTQDAAAFAPHDVPSMPGMAQAPMTAKAKVEALNPNANPASPFLPKRRAQKPVRVYALPHLFAKDAGKPTAAGTSTKLHYAGAAPAAPRNATQSAPAQPKRKRGYSARQLDAALRAARLKARRELAAREDQLLGQAVRELRRREGISTPQQADMDEVEVDVVDEPPTEEAENWHESDNPAVSFLESEAHLSLYQGQRHRFLARSLRAVDEASRDAVHRRMPRSSAPLANIGSSYANPRFRKQGVAAEYAKQEPHTQKLYANTATPDSAAPDAQDRVSTNLQDHWSYDLEKHEWELVRVRSSQPLAHSPWLSAQQMQDPVLKDPLPVLLPPTRRLHTAVVMKHRMLIFGGVSHNNLILGDLWIFDPAEGSWIEASADGPGGSPILPREGHSAVTLKDELTMLVFGGVSYGFLPFNDLWQYSAVDNAWTRLTGPTTQNAPMQRWLHTAVHYVAPDSEGGAESMIVFGGLTAHYVPLNDVHVWDVASSSWSGPKVCTGTPPFPRMMHTAVVVRDTMLVSGGAANNLPLDDLWALDLRTFHWRELLMTGGYPFARTGASAIVLSPLKRARELGLEEDLDEDAHDPHLNWRAPASASLRPAVGSFSSEGLASHEEQAANLAGLDQIAFPQNPVFSSPDDGKLARPRPMFRYRKHSRNNLYVITFGGASATSAPHDETQLQRERESVGE